MYYAKILNRFIYISLLITASWSVVLGQDYNSVADGDWTVASNWNNTSGWGGSIPTINNGNGTLNISHDIELSEDLDLGSRTVNINDGAVLTLGGNLTLSGGSDLIVKSGGSVWISGDVVLNSFIHIHRGGRVIVDGSVTVVSSPYLEIAEPATTPNGDQYADMVIKQNLNLSGSGSITINYHARLAVFGNVSSNGGGTKFTINDGGQVYIDGDIRKTGGDLEIKNNNVGDENNPFGLYVNGAIHNPGGNGGGTTSNKGDRDEMFNSNPDFAAWVGAQPNSPLISVQPVTLLTFEASEITPDYIILSWSTASETNNSHFELYRSKDAKNWMEIAQIEGNGTTTIEQQYTFQDRYAVQGLNYYMLKQVDYDGMSETFPAIVVENNVAEYTLSVYPNPSVDFINMDFPDEAGNITVKMYDMSGHLMKSEEIYAHALRWDISEFQSATYIVKVESEQYQFPIQRIFKQ